MHMEESCEISSKGRSDSLCIHNWKRHWEMSKSCWGLEPGVTMWVPLPLSAPRAAGRGHAKGAEKVFQTWDET